MKRDAFARDRMPRFSLKAVGKRDDNEDESFRGGGRSPLRFSRSKPYHSRSKTGSQILHSLPAPGRVSDRRPPAIRNLARSVPIFAIIRKVGNPNDTYHRLRQASLDFHRGPSTTALSCSPTASGDFGQLDS